VTGLYGGAFDPPHNGHVALARAAQEHFGFGRFVVLVAEHPGHKPVHAAAEARLRLAEAAFPGLAIELDPHAWTVDMLRARDWDDPVFLVGADQLAAFQTWKEPEAVLELARLGVATRPGYLVGPSQARIEPFEIPAIDASSSEVRRRVTAGEPIDYLVPPAVARVIEELGLYRQDAGLH
jgi:nicotinate-nucleotide adenylyltransferase